MKEITEGAGKVGGKKKINFETPGFREQISVTHILCVTPPPHGIRQPRVHYFLPMTHQKASSRLLSLIPSPYWKGLHLKTSVKTSFMRSLTNSKQPEEALSILTVPLIPLPHREILRLVGGTSKETTTPQVAPSRKLPSQSLKPETLFHSLRGTLYLNSLRHLF